MDNETVVQILNLFALMSFVGLSLAIFGRLAHRFFLFQEAKSKTPVLLKRDIALFSGVVVFVILVLIARVLGITDLSQNILWIFVSNSLVQIPLAYWAYVEYTQ